MIEEGCGGTGGEGAVCPIPNGSVSFQANTTRRLIENDRSITRRQ